MSRVRFPAALALVVALGLAARLVYALVVMRGVAVGGDGLEFHILANQLAGGDGYVQPLIVSPGHVATADKPPLYPLLLAVPSLLGWKTLVAHRVVSCLMGAALVSGVGLLGRRVGGERAGLIAALIAALYPLLVVLDGSLRSESLYAPLIAFGLLATYRLVDRPSVGRAVAFGALAGFAVLTRSEAVVLAGLLLVMVAVRLPSGARTRLVAIAVLVTALVLAPWVVRNWSEFGRPLVLSTNSGSLAYGANCHAAYYSGQIGSWPCYPRLAVAPGRDEADVSAELRDTGARYARDHAGRLPAVAGVRLLRSFDLWAPGPATRLEAGIGDRDLSTYRVGVAVYYLLLPLAIAGAVILRRRREPLRFLMAPVVVTAVVSVLGYGTPRFRVPAEIPLVVLAAVAVAAIGATTTRAVRGERQPAGVA
jgi:4-amino-4-deoxy-L-arabinose transferase-like glycosyltransferase